jgi:hypothetical protein
MTVTTTTAKKTFTGDGSTTGFAYNFKILASSDLTVYLRLIASPYSETLQTETTHYSVAGVGDAGGGTVTMVTAPPTTDQLILLRAVPQTQLTDYTANDAFPAETHEEALDRLAMIVQDQQETLDRTLKVSKTVTDLTTPEFSDPAAARADKFLAFDGDGDELTVTDGPLADTSITSAADANVLLYDGTDTRWENKAVTGDIAITSAGVASIASGVVVNADVNASAAIVDTKLATISTADKVSGAAVQVDGAADGTGITIANTDKFLIDDAGTSKYVNASQINSYVSASVAADDIATGDAAASFETSSGAVVVDSQASTTTVDGHTGVTIQSSSSGDILLDSAADVVLDAAGNDIGLKASGTQFGALSNASSDFVIAASVEDKDILLKGDDGGSAITALTLDMSDAGTATFNSGIIVGGDVDLSGGARDVLMVDNTAAALEIAEGSNKYLTFVTTDSGEKITLGKKLEAGAVEIEGSAFDINGGNVDGTAIGAASASTIVATTVTVNTSIVPDASGGADIGSTSAEWGDVFIADDKFIKLGSDQNFTIEYDEDGTDTTRVVAANGLTFAPHGTSSGNTTEIRLMELAANGDNYAGFKAADSITGTSVYTLPAAYPASNKVLQSTDAGVLTWESAAAGFDPDGAVTFNDSRADVDFIIKSDTNATAFVLDGAAAGSIGIGSAAVNYAGLFLGQAAVTAVADTNYYRMRISPQGTLTIPSGTAAEVATLDVYEPWITATGTVTYATSLWIHNAPTEATNNSALRVDGDVLITHTNGQATLFIGPANSTHAGVGAGICIDQTGSDDFAFVIKSSGDVATGLTSSPGSTETDDYFSVWKSSATQGGAKVLGLAEGIKVARALQLEAWGEGANLNGDKASNTLQGGMDFTYTGHDGANGLENLGADSVVFGWRANLIGGAGRALMGLDEDGDIHVDGSSTVSTFDHYDDIAMMAQLDLTRCVEFQPHLAKLMSPSRFDGNAYTLEHYEGTKLIGVMEDTLARDKNDDPIPEFDPKTGEPNEGYRIVPVAEQKAAGHTPLINITAVERLNAGAWRQTHQLFDCIIQCMEDRDPGYKAALREHLVHCDLPTQILDWEGDHDDSPLHDIVDPGPIPPGRGIAPPPPAFNE